MGSAGNIFGLMADFNEAIREGQRKMEIWRDGWNDYGNGADTCSMIEYCKKHPEYTKNCTDICVFAQEIKKEETMTQEDKVATQLFEKIEMFRKQNKTVRHGYEKTVNIVLDTSGSMSMWEYIDSIKKITNKLFSIAEPKEYSLHIIYKGNWQGRHSISELKNNDFMDNDPNYPFVNKLTADNIHNCTAVNVFITDGYFENMKAFNDESLKKVPSIILSPVKFPRSTYVPDGWHIVSMNNQAELKEKENTMKVTELKNGDSFQFVDKNVKIYGPVYKKIRGINQTTVSAEWNGTLVKAKGNVVKVDVSKVDAPKVEKKETVENQIKFSQAEVGDKFYLVHDKNKIPYEKVSAFLNSDGFWFSAETYNGKIPVLFYPDDKIILIKEEIDNKEPKKSFIFYDLKIGDNFTFSHAKKYNWGKDWEGIFEKDSNDSVVMKDGDKKITNINPYSPVILVTKAVKKTVKTESKKQLTFGDLKVGDKFVMTISSIGKIGMEKLMPFKDKSGYWLNAKLLEKQWWVGCYEGTAVLDQQEVELIKETKTVEKKLTIADLKAGEKFRFRNLGGDETRIHKKVQCDNFKFDNSYSYFINPENNVSAANHDEEVERVVEEVKKNLTLKDLKVGDKFKFVDNRDVVSLFGECYVANRDCPDAVRHQLENDEVAFFDCNKVFHILSNDYKVEKI